MKKQLLLASNRMNTSALRHRREPVAGEQAHRQDRGPVSVQRRGRVHQRHRAGQGRALRGLRHLRRCQLRHRRHRPI